MDLRIHIIYWLMFDPRRTRL